MNAADDRAAELASLLTRMDEANEAAALRAKNQAAEILAEADLSFSALATQIEERQLLMPPDIVAAIKRMDLPGEGDAAFIGARKLLQRAKLGFGRIAEALDNTGVSPAEHSSLEEEFTKLQHAYWAERDKNIRQQGTIIGLKAATGQS